MHSVKDSDTFPNKAHNATASMAEARIRPKPFEGFLALAGRACKVCLRATVQEMPDSDELLTPWCTCFGSQAPLAAHTHAKGLSPKL